jgi:DNA invertase Pin-like site-specific DNA recombinase
VRDILLALLSSLAKQESRRMSERTKARMALARMHGTRSGKPIGRKPIAPKVRDQITKRIGLSARRSLATRRGKFPVEN